MKSKILCIFAVFCGMSSFLYGQDVEQITLTTTSRQIHLRGAFVRGRSAAQATVNWGDGTTDFVTGSSLENFAFEANHQYIGETSRNITIRSAFLAELDCSNNQLTALNVTGNTALTVLRCGENQLTALDVSRNTALTALYCEENRLTALNVNHNPALLHLWCYSNRLTALDVSSNTALIKLWCSGNQLTALDVSMNAKLTFLWCAANQFTALDVSNNTKLIELYCDNNQLTALDVSKNTALFELLCNENQLTALDVSMNTALTFLWCHSNQFTEPAMNALFKSLPARSENTKGNIRSDSKPEHAAANQHLATDKGWEVIE